MEDIFSASRDGNLRFVKTWLENTSNDLNQGDDHGFTPLLWSAREGQGAVFDLLLSRGARVTALNDGGDSGLHLAASKGNKGIIQRVRISPYHLELFGLFLRSDNKLHSTSNYLVICMPGIILIAKELVKRGGLVSQCNKRGETPLDKCKPYLAEILRDLAAQLGQDLKRIPHKDHHSKTGKKDELRNIKSRLSWIQPSEIDLTNKIGKTVTGEMWKGKWNDIHIVGKKLAIKIVNKRISRDFSEEYSKLRSNANSCILLVTLVWIILQMFDLFLFPTGIIVDHEQGMKFALDIAKGMEYLHSLEQLIPRLYLKSTHIMIDEDLTARICMADYRFSFMNLSKIESPNWMAPEVLQKSPEEVDQRSADMWSYAMILWELVTREVPFGHLSPMEVGMKVALEGLRPSVPPGMSSQMTKLVSICWNNDPAKRPRFDQILPILNKMAQ
ncbi:PREDICTED: integrin-linked protein kinase-like [Acropora digitifera]|uniref:integrin-linked protein kinase-like n=1 Tax=Acropora digitifera TaxID=70779 RepID=UPI00077A99FD|nr:PREDICTED: integrin-linked protein kinase-like [Acropora digitifera]